MKNIIDALPLPRANSVPKGAKEVFFHLSAAVVGFMTAQTGIFGNYSPFGIAFAGALPKEYILSGALGAGAGYIVSKELNMPLRYMAALTVLVISAYAVRSGRKLKNESLWLCLCAFGAAFLSGIAILIAEGFTAAGFIMYSAEALLAGGSLFFFKKSFDILSNGLTSPTPYETSCLAVAGSIFLAAASGISFMGFAPGRAAAVIVILLASSLGKEAGGAVAGASLGAVMSLLPGSAHLGAVYSAGGVLSGAFARGGKLPSACAFALTAAIVTFSVTGGEGAAATIAETAVATVIYVLIPKNITDGLGKVLIKGKEDVKGDDGLRRALVMRLGVASKAMAEASDCAEKVTRELKVTAEPDCTEIYRKVQQAVCKKCGLRSFCWDKNFEDTLSVFNDMAYTLRSGEELNKTKLPHHFAKRCIRSHTLTEAMAEEYASFTLKAAEGRDITRVRSIVADQFSALSDMLRELSEEFGDVRNFSKESAARGKKALENHALAVEDILCTTDRYGRMTVEACCKKTEGSVNARELTFDLSRACGREFSLPGVTDLGESRLISFGERAVFTAQTGVCQIPASENEPCGDCCKCFDDGRGRQFMIISDGMGTGKKAAVDGRTGAELISRLLKAGFGFGSALSVVNSTLLLKSAEESFATLDIACIDLFTGKAEILKAGAPATFVRKNGKCRFTEKPSLPAGILREVKFAESEIYLKEGDIIVMVSDGALSGGSDWITREIENFKDGSAAALAAKIAEGAKRRNENLHSDDITAAVVLIGK